MSFEGIGMMDWELRPLHRDLGVEIVDVDLKNVSDTEFEALHHIIHTQGFALFRNQTMDADQTVSVARRFGEPLPGYRPEFTHPNYEELVQLGNIVENGRVVTYLNTQGVEWHSDGTGAVLDANVTMLYALEAPERGGETLFASAVKAYASLPETMKQTLDGLTVVNSFDHHNDRVAVFAGTNVKPRDRGLRQRNPDKTEALVQIHPVTGERHLFVTHQMVKEVSGYSYEEGKALVMSLVEHMTREDCVYTHHWKVGDLIVFDNRSALHSATPYTYSDQRRLMYQVIIGQRREASALSASA